VSSYCVQRLREDSEYMFRVTAENPVGVSDALESDTVTIRSKFGKFRMVLTFLPHQQWLLYLILYSYTDMCRLTMGIRSEHCVVKTISLLCKCVLTQT
jgi:hypothetical protein